MPTSIIAASLPTHSAMAVDPSESGPEVLSVVTPGSVPSTKINAGFLAIEQLARVAIGGYAVLSGFGLTFSGLTLTVAAGIAAIDAVVVLDAPKTIVLPASQSNVWVYLTQAGTLAYATNLIQPGGKNILIGHCVTSSSAITGTDTSGVRYALGGMIWRTTGDAGAPGDTLGAAERVWTKTSGGTYLWNGSAHLVIS